MWKHDNSDENQQLQEPGIEPTHGRSERSSEKSIGNQKSTCARFRTHALQVNVDRQLEIKKTQAGNRTHALKVQERMKRSVSLMAWCTHKRSKDTQAWSRQGGPMKRTTSTHAGTDEANPRSNYRRRRTAVSTVFSGGTGGDS